MIEQILKSLMQNDPAIQQERKERKAFFDANAPQIVKDSVRTMAENQIVTLVDEMTSSLLKADALYKKDYPNGNLNIEDLMVEMIRYKFRESRKFPAKDPCEGHHEGIQLIEGWRAEIDHGDARFFGPSGVERTIDDLPSRVRDDYLNKRDTNGTVNRMPF